MPVRCSNRHITSQSILRISDAVYRATTDTQAAPLHYLHPRSLVSASSGRRCYSRSGEAKTVTPPGKRLERCRSTSSASHQRRATSSAAIDDTDPYSPESSAGIQDERNGPTSGPSATAHGRAKKERRYNPNSEKARNDLQQMVETLQNMTKDPDRRIIHRESDALHYYRLPISPLVRRKRVPNPQRKPKPSEDQRGLNSDPWAQILASPVRHCTGSGARLPIALLTNWGFMRHPDDKTKVYVMPHGLVDGIQDLETMGQGLLDRKAKQRGLSRVDGDAENIEQPRADDGASEDRIGLREISSTTRKGNAPAIRILPYYNLLRQLNTQFTKQVDPTNPSSREARPGSAALLVPTLWKFRLDEVRHYEAHRRELAAQTGLADLRPSNEEATIDTKKLNWRTDAPSKVLDVIRQRVAAALKRVTEVNCSGLSTKRRGHLSFAASYRGIAMAYCTPRTVLTVRSARPQHWRRVSRVKTTTIVVRRTIMVDHPMSKPFNACRQNMQPSTRHVLSSTSDLNPHRDSTISYPFPPPHPSLQPSPTQAALQS